MVRPGGVQAIGENGANIENGGRVGRQSSAAQKDTDGCGVGRDEAIEASWGCQDMRNRSSREPYLQQMGTANGYRTPIGG
jgi:hypothetical protein